MKVKVTKGSETLLIEDTSVEAWKNAGWKVQPEEKPDNKDIKGSK